MMTFIFMISWIMMLMFTFLKHPLSFGLILLIQTLIISLITGIMNYSFWFSYILFLVMVGGMLILFIYMTSIASNEKFKFSQLMFMIFLILMMSSMMSIFLDQFIPMNLSNTLDLIPSDYESFKSLSMTKYISWPSNKIMFMMFIYLLITLIMVVKVTKIKYGPIRQKF